MCERRKAQASVLARDDHAEKALVLDVLPDVWRKIVQLVSDLPVVDHRAQLFDRAIDEVLLVRAQRRFRVREQLVPVGLAAEEIAVPPYRSGVEGLLLGLGHLRQNAFEKIE